MEKASWIFPFFHVCGGGESVKNEKIKNFHSNKFWEWRIIYSVWSQKKEFCSYRHFSCIAIHHILLRSLLVREVRGKIIAVWYFNVSTLPRSILTRCTNARQLKNIKRENRSEEVKMLCWNKGKFMEAEIPIALKVRASSLQHCTLCHYMHINSYIGGANAKISEFLHFFLSEKCKNFFYYMHNAIIASTYAQSQFPSLWWWWWRCGAMQCEKKKVDKHIVHMHTHTHWIIWRRKSLKVTRHHHPMNKKPREWGTFFYGAHI